jgi:HAD superfamily hydrolase (TIGR01509 family)
MDTSFAVIFDMDGVIVDSNPAHKESIKEFCRRHGIEVTDSFLKEKVYGRTNSDWVPRLFPEASESEIRELSDEKEALFRRIFSPNKFVVKGLLNLIEQLEEKGVSMAVATSAPLENEKFILNALSIRDKFKTILHSSHVENSKPAPDIYQKASEQISQDPSNCIVFKDSVPGASAALEAGCYTVGVMTTYSSDDLTHCHRTIRDFAGISYTLLSRWIGDFHPHEKMKEQ